MAKKENKTKSTKQKKIRIIEQEDEDDNQELIPLKSCLVIGDIQIHSSRSSLQSCKKLAEEMLHSRAIKNYLAFYPKKKFLSSQNTFIG